MGSRSGSTHLKITTDGVKVRIDSTSEAQSNGPQPPPDFSFHSTRRAGGRDNAARFAAEARYAELLWRPPLRPHVPITTDPRARATPSAGLLCACAPPRATLLHATPGTRGFGPRRKPEATRWGYIRRCRRCDADQTYLSSAFICVICGWPFRNPQRERLCLPASSFKALTKEFGRVRRRVLGN